MQANFHNAELCLAFAILINMKKNVIQQKLCVTAKKKKTVGFLQLIWFKYTCISLQEEEYKRLSEALAEDGTYNSVGFQYRSDYYDPSQPTEEEDPQKDEKGEFVNKF